MYVEDRFLSFFQALEAYDRRIHKQSPDDKAIHEQRVERILSVLDAVDRVWLADVLRGAGQMGAKERRLSPVKGNNPGWLLDETPVDQAKTLRNYLTHYDPKVEKKLPLKENRAKELNNLAAQLRGLCEVILLRKLGL